MYFWLIFCVILDLTSHNCLATTIVPSISSTAELPGSSTASLEASDVSVSASVSAATTTIDKSNALAIEVTSATAVPPGNVAPTASTSGTTENTANAAPSGTTSVPATTSGTTAVNTTTQKTTTKKPTTPTTLSPLVLKQIWCRTNYASWKMPDVSGCVDTFRSTCAETITNSTNAFLLCKDLLGKNPSSQYTYKMLLLGMMDDLGMQLARNFFAWKDQTSKEEKYTLKRIIKDKMIFENALAYKWGDMILPNYHRKELFPTSQWNKRNDTIKLPYATITAGVFKYSFGLYDNIFDADVEKDEMRLKNTWKSGHLIQSGIYIHYLVEKDLIYSPKFKINSAVVSLSIEPKPKSPVASDIIITLWHKKPGMFKPWCVYWQFIKSTDANAKYIDGYWTNYGMRVVKTNATTTVCASNHLSAFAVIMEPVYEVPTQSIDDFTLATIIMTVVSIIILIVYLVAMVMLGCVNTQYSRMYMYIAAACLLSQIVFVLALMKKDNWSMCTTMSIIMQFCHTTVMSWMMIESVHQLSRIRYFFNEINTNIEAFYCCVGWGFPFAVVISLIGYPFEQFSNIKYCWVYVKGFEMWFFAGPLVALLLISAILRLITYYEICKHPERLKRDINYQRAWRSLVASIFFLPLIGTLWIVATLGVTKKETESGPYLIIIPVLNLIVGLLVFIFYFYKNDEVHDALVEQRKIKEKKRLLRYEHLRGMKMKVTYQS